MIDCPYPIRPRDFDTLEGWASDNESLTDMAEDIAWYHSVGDRFAWGLFFNLLREFRARDKAVCNS